MEEKILTIRNIRFSGKWVEFWFEEMLDEFEDGYHYSSKQAYLYRAVDAAGIDYQVRYKGIEWLYGKKIKLDDLGYGWGIVGFVVERPKLEIKMEKSEHPIVGNWYENTKVYLIKGDERVIITGDEILALFDFCHENRKGW